MILKDTVVDHLHYNPCYSYAVALKILGGFSTALFALGSGVFEAPPLLYFVSVVLISHQYSLSAILGIGLVSGLLIVP